MALSCPEVLSALSPGLCAPVDHYCERLSSAWDAEPVNAVTNVAFLLAAAGASYMLDSVRDAQPRKHLALLTYVTALVGLGSLLFHTVGTRWAEWGDVIPITLFLALYLWIAFSKFLGLPAARSIALIVLIVGATFAAEARVSPAVLHGGALYVPIVVTLVALGAVLLRTQPVAGGGVIAAAAVFIVSLTVRTLDASVCDSFASGTHFLWHVCNAIVLYILTTVAILHGQIVRNTA